MKPKHLAGLSLAVLAPLGALAWPHAATADPSRPLDELHNQCNFTNTSNNQTMTFNLALGDFFVPRNAPIGSSIGNKELFRSVANAEGLQLTCNRNRPDIENPRFTSHVIAVAPIHARSLPMREGEDLTGKIFLTDVPGVGIALQMRNPYLGGQSSSQFTPVGGSAYAPFEAHNDHQEFVTNTVFDDLVVKVDLVKIGEIPAGVHSMGPKQLIKGTFTGIQGDAYTVSINGTVRQAQCSLNADDPVSDSPVSLGEWSTQNFTGPGSTTAAKPFSINLQDCEDNTGNDELGFATAYVKFEGTLGSTVLQPDLGLFSLSDRSTATGVGIQLLKQDGLTPVFLEEDVEVTRIAPSGAMQLPFSARFYQLPDAASVTGGLALGALKFTVSYK